MMFIDLLEQAGDFLSGHVDHQVQSAAVSRIVRFIFLSPDSVFFSGLSVGHPSDDTRESESSTAHGHSRQRISEVFWNRRCRFTLRKPIQSPNPFPNNNLRNTHPHHFGTPSDRKTRPARRISGAEDREAPRQTRQRSGHDESTRRLFGHLTAGVMPRCSSVRSATLLIE